MGLEVTTESTTVAAEDMRNGQIGKIITGSKAHIGRYVMRVNENLFASIGSTNWWKDPPEATVELLPHGILLRYSDPKVTGESV